MEGATDELEGVRHFRQGRGRREQRTTTLELFFDLVFVFAVTQLSHALVDDLTWAGAARTLFLLLLVWWGWNYTTWMTNFADPESVPVRLMLIGAMLASLLMAVAIPEAFGERAVLFAVSYVALQVIRNAVIAWISPAGTAARDTFAAILAWSIIAGALLIVGAFLPYDARVVVWIAALAFDYAGPALRYRLPGMRRVTTDQWAVDAGHFSERFQLFIIIALGESIVVTGATASDLGLDAARLTAIAVAFVGTAALWWLYFDYVAAVAGRRLEAAGDSGRMARDAFTYLHIPIVAGIIVSAVGDEIVIAHPGAELHTPELVALVAGPAIYLVGHLLFRLRMAGTISLKRVAATIAVLACGFVGLVAPALVVAALIVAVLVGLIVWEAVAGHRRRAAGIPSPLEELAAREGVAVPD